VIRVSWLCDVRGQNFMQTMLRLGRSGKALKVVNDQYGTPTFARPFAEALMNLAAHPHAAARGVHHYSHLGQTTWHGFAQAIFDFHGLEVNLAACSTSEYPTPAQRPAYSCLDGREFARLIEQEQRDWKDVMASELKRDQQEN
jgi:dTDP-4-dehydrorhamnose reductase